MAFEFICGTDDFLVLREGQARWETLAANVPDEYSREIIDGQAGTVDEAVKAISQFISAIQTVSLFGDRKAVWFRNITFLADSVTGRSATTLEMVEQLQNALASYDQENVAVLLSASPVDRRKKAFKWFQKNSSFQFIDAGKDTQHLIPLIQQEATRQNASLSHDAAEMLLEKINGNSRMAMEEIQKLVTYLGGDGGEITPDLVTALVPNFGEGEMFETVEAFYALNLEWTLDAIHRHFFSGYDARPMITSLQNRNRLLIQLKTLEMEGILRGRINQAVLDKAASSFQHLFGDDNSKSAFNVFTQHPYYLSRLVRPLPKLSLKRLMAFQEAFLESFRGIIRRPNEQESVMRETAIRCLS